MPAQPQRRSGSLTHGSLSTLTQPAVPDPQVRFTHPLERRGCGCRGDGGGHQRSALGCRTCFIGSRQRREVQRGHAHVRCCGALIRRETFSTTLRTAVFKFAPRSLCFSKKSKASPKAAWKDGQCTAERESARAYLARLERRQNYLKNPRFFPPNAPQGGKSLIVSPGEVEQTVARGGAADLKGYGVCTVG